MLRNVQQLKTQHLSTGDQVHDRSGQPYTLGTMIASGRDGALYRCASDRSRSLRLFPIPLDDDALVSTLEALDVTGLSVCRPITWLGSDHPGFVTDACRADTPLSSLIGRPEIPSTGSGNQSHELGLRNRLELLALLAESLEMVQRRGMTYGALSAETVLVDLASLTNGEPSAINLSAYESLRLQSGSHETHWGDPLHAAPELHKGLSGVNSLTVAYALAVLVHEVLTGEHPLMGSMARQDPDTMTEPALQGALPWTGHPKDDRNRLPLDQKRKDEISTILDPKTRLPQLLDRTFRTGLNSPMSRPGVGHWARALRTAAGSTIRCEQCACDFYVHHTSCPSCRAPRPLFVYGQAMIWNPEESKEQTAKASRTTLDLGIANHASPMRFNEKQLGCAGSAPEPALMVELEKARKDKGGKLKISNLMKTHTVEVSKGIRDSTIATLEPNSEESFEPRDLKSVLHLHRIEPKSDRMSTHRVFKIGFVGAAK